MTDSQEILKTAESKAVKQTFAAVEGVDAPKLAAAKQQMDGLKIYEVHDTAQRAFDTGAQGVKAKLVTAAQQDADTARNGVAEAMTALASTNPADGAAMAAAQAKLATFESLQAKQDNVLASMKALSSPAEILKAVQSIASQGGSGDVQAKLKQAIEQGQHAQIG
eukprot:gene3163-3935_t